MTQKKHTLSIIAVMVAAVLSISAVSTALTPVMAQEGGQTFTATLSGSNEVPPTESSANGTAKFVVNVDGSEVSYWVNTAGLKQIIGAHIHTGAEGENGDVVVALAQEESAEDQDNPEIQLTGNITKDDLDGPLEDMEVVDLVSLMSNGSAYVNVHTEIYQDGAIRGQIGSEAQGATSEGGSSSLTTDGNTSSSETEQSSTTEESSSTTESSNTTS
jgi:hypothetical protein